MADLNGDHNLDVIIASSTSGKVIWLDNVNGDGTFNASQEHILTSGAGTNLSVSTADVNHDGLMDLLTASSSGNNISAWTNNGEGGAQTTFSQSSSAAVAGASNVTTTGSVTNGGGGASDHAIDVVGVSNVSGPHIDVLASTGHS